MNHPRRNTIPKGYYVQRHGSGWRFYIENWAGRSALYSSQMTAIDAACAHHALFNSEN